METLIAILWWLHILMSNTPYNDAQVTNMINSNQAAIDSCQANPAIMQEINDNYTKRAKLEDGENLIVVWEPTEGGPIED